MIKEGFTRISLDLSTSVLDLTDELSGQMGISRAGFIRLAVLEKIKKNSKKRITLQ